eukprot:15350698-Alexandrium_andersonii.AAC.1
MFRLGPSWLQHYAVGQAMRNTRTCASRCRSPRSRALRCASNCPRATKRPGSSACAISVAGACALVSM